MANKRIRSRARLLALALPLWWHRYQLVVWLALALSVMAGGALQPQWVQQWRTTMLDWGTPLVAVLQRPVQTIQAWHAEWQQMLTAGQANQILRATVAAQQTELRQLREALATADAWRQSLGPQLRGAGVPQFNAAATPALVGRTPIMARVVAMSGGPFSQTMLLAAGSAQGVTRDMIALGPNGVVGRVIEVGRNAARLLLITDSAARVPVRFVGQAGRAVAVGQQSNLLALSYLLAEQQPPLGSVAVTSGDGGIFPPDLPVGVVVSEADQLQVQVAPLQPLDFVELRPHWPAALAQELTPATVPQ